VRRHRHHAGQHQLAAHIGAGVVLGPVATVDRHDLELAIGRGAAWHQRERHRAVVGQPPQAAAGLDQV
jgi:hypothetical protein